MPKQNYPNVHHMQEMIQELQKNLVNVVMNKILFETAQIQNLKMKASNVLKQANVSINLRARRRQASI